MKLKCEKKVMIKCDYYDLDQFIQHHFNQSKYEFVADIEGNNYTSYTYNVEPKKMDEEKLMNFIRYNKGMYLIKDLLNQLCFENKLEKGEYIINVSW